MVIRVLIPVSRLPEKGTVTKSGKKVSIINSQYWDLVNFKNLCCPRAHEDGYNFDEQYYTWQDYEDAVREAYNEKPHKRIMEGTDESIDLVDYFFKTTLCIEALFYREGNAGLWQDAHHYSENKNDIILLLPKLFPYFITEFMRLYYAEIPSHGKSLKESRDAYVETLRKSFVPLSALTFSKERVHIYEDNQRMRSLFENERVLDSIWTQLQTLIKNHNFYKAFFYLKRDGVALSLLGFIQKTRGQRTFFPITAYVEDDVIKKDEYDHLTRTLFNIVGTKCKLDDLITYGIVFLHKNTYEESYYVKEDFPTKKDLRFDYRVVEKYMTEDW